MSIKHRLSLTIGFLFGTVVLPIAGDVAKESQANEQLLKFKQFISSPPIIDSIFYRIISPTNTDVGLPEGDKDAPLHGTVKYFLGSWQPDCLYLKSASFSNIIQSGHAPFEEVVAKCGENYSRIAASGFLTSWKDTSSDPMVAKMEPTRIFQHRSKQFRELMNMGVMAADIGSLRWQNDRFVGKGYVPEQKVRVQISGTIQTSNGLPVAMHVQYLSSAGVYNYVLRYSYKHTTNPTFLPSMIESFWISKGSEIKELEWDVISITLSRRPIAYSAFDLKVPEKTPSIIFTNGNYYAKNLNGGWTPISTPEGQVTGFTKLKGLSSIDNYYFTAVGIFTFMTFSTIWRIYSKNQKQRKVLKI